MLYDLYKRLDACYGDLHWWPGDSPLEIIVGAILTQNTSWINVEKCIVLLKKNKMLSVRAIRAVPAATLARFIRSSGYFNQKSIKLKNFIRFLDGSYGGRLAGMNRAKPAELRAELLCVKGIGPETADSILLYACQKPVFVVDAYTRRIMRRLGVLKGDEPYEDIRAFFEERISRNAVRYSVHGNAGSRDNRLVRIYNQYHALIVNLGKDFCRSREPRCDSCPLKGVGRCKI